MQCPKCNSIVLAGSKQCLYCHADLSAAHVGAHSTDTKKTGSRGLRDKFAAASAVRRQPQSTSSYNATSLSSHKGPQAQEQGSGSSKTGMKEPLRQAPLVHHLDDDVYAQQGPLEKFLAGDERLEGKFKLAEEIGRGGMGFVYRGVDLSLNREIAVKILPPHYNNDDSVVGRFRREARAMASLDHPNIVTVYSIGYEHGLHYFAMKLLHGETLAHTIKRVARGLRAPLELEEMIDLMIQACNGLEHAHSKSLLHRDIKPGNLMLSAGGALTIMDFGIVKDLGGTDSIGLKTAHGKIFGTPEYMPPEQAMGKGDYSPASDLYALAVVGYELLCGELPYVADTPIGIIIQHIRAQIPPLKGRAAGRYPLIESIFHKALAKDPRARYESADDFRAALAGVQRSLKKTQLKEIDPKSSPHISVSKSSPNQVGAQNQLGTTSIDQIDPKDLHRYQDSQGSAVPESNSLPSQHESQRGDAMSQEVGSTQAASPKASAPPVSPPVSSPVSSPVSPSLAPSLSPSLSPSPSPVPKRDAKAVSLQKASKRPGHYKRPILKRKK